MDRRQRQRGIRDSKTPQVTVVTNGRVEYNGNSVILLLRPTGGALGSASRISLAAMRLIEAPLTGLPELNVYANQKSYEMAIRILYCAPSF